VQCWCTFKNIPLPRFTECRNGLSYFDTSIICKTNNNNITEYSFLSTVKNNKANIRRRKIEGADQARILQQLINWPSIQDFKEIIFGNQLRNLLKVTVV